MAPVTFKDIIREYYKKGVEIMDLGLFRYKHNITFHKKSSIHIAGRPEEYMKIRTLKREMFSGMVFEYGENTAHERLVTPSLIKLHTLDDKCVIIPSVVDYIGAYRFIPSDDKPTLVSSRMAYLRCPNILIAVSLSLWLRHPRVVEAIRTEFRKKGRLKEMTAEFIGHIPVPEGMLQPHIVGRALEIDNEIQASHKRLTELVGELSEMSAEYA